MAKIEWIAVFKKDFIAKFFSEPGKSNDVMYWINVKEDGRIATAKTTGNSYNLRSIKIYDNDFQLCEIKSEDENWKCTKIIELSKDGWGSNCICTIIDKNGKEFDIKLHGRYYKGPSGKNNASINFELYFSSILFFLNYISQYEGWLDLQLKNEEAYDDIVSKNGVPQKIFKNVDERDNYLKRIG